MEIISATLAFLGLLFICGLALDFVRHAKRFLDR
jgi:hypothetical protein